VKNNGLDAKEIKANLEGKERGKEFFKKKKKKKKRKKKASNK